MPDKGIPDFPEVTSSQTDDLVWLTRGLGVDRDKRIKVQNLLKGIQVAITDTTESTDKDTGALIVEGGAGIEKNLNVGGNLGVNGVDRSIGNYGELIGELLFNSISLPPTLKAGIYDVKGNRIHKTSDTVLAMTDVLGDSSQTLADYSYNWMFELINENRDVKFCPAFDKETDVKSGQAFTALSVSSNVATITSASLPTVGHTVTVMTTGGELIQGKVLTSGAGIFTVKTSLADASYGAGTYDENYRIQTYHGTGARVDVNTNTDIEKYTPSPIYNSNYNCYGTDQYGRVTAGADMVWRIAGIWYVNGSGNVTHVISYKSGQNKNDNELRSNASTSSYVGNLVRWTIPTKFSRLWGNDWGITDDGTNAFMVTANRRISIKGNYSTSTPVASGASNWLVNGSTRVAARASASTDRSTPPILINLQKGDNIQINASTGQTFNYLQIDGEVK